MKPTPVPPAHDVTTPSVVIAPPLPCQLTCACVLERAQRVQPEMCDEQTETDTRNNMV